MKIVELTVLMEVPDDIAATYEHGDDPDDRAVNAAIDALTKAFPKVEVEPTGIQLGMTLARKVTTE